MTTAEKTLKWWNDYLEQNKTYPLVAEIEMQLNLAVDNEPKVKNLAIHDVSNNEVELVCLDCKNSFTETVPTICYECEQKGIKAN